MAAFLAQYGSTIAVGAVVASVIVFSAYQTFKNAKSSPCGGGCSGCSGCGETSHCHTKEQAGD